MEHDAMWHEMSRRKLLGSAATGAAALAGASLLAACGGSDESGTSTGAASDAKAVRGGTLTVGLTSGGKAETLSVPGAINVPDSTRVKQLYDGLFRWGADSPSEPALAIAATPNDDATVWTLKLRDGVVWHDGKPFTADDVVWTIKSWKDPKHNFNGIGGTLIDTPRVRKRDTLTVEVPLTRGIAEFPTLLSHFGAYMTQDGFTDFGRPVGTGPFKFQSFTPGRRSVFSANADYWAEGTPYVDTLVIDSSFADENARLNALLAGSIDIMPGMPFALAKHQQASGALRIGNSPGPSCQSFNCRVDRAPFKDDPRVIQALKLVVDRPVMVENVFGGYATEGTDIVGKKLPYFATDIDAERDVEKAKALLKAAGYSDLKLELNTSPVLAGLTEAATLFAQQAKDAGIDVSLKRIDPGTYFTAASGYPNYPFSMEYVQTVISLTNYYLQFLHADAPYNETGWGDPRSDALLFDAIAETDTAKARDKWHEVQQLQVDRGGLIVYANQNWVDGYGLEVQGLDTSPAGWCDNHNYRVAWLGKA